MCIFCSLCVGYICVEILTSICYLMSFAEGFPQVTTLKVVCCFSLKTLVVCFETSRKSLKLGLSEKWFIRETTD